MAYQLIPNELFSIPEAIGAVSISTSNCDVGKDKESNIQMIACIVFDQSSSPSKYKFLSECMLLDMSDYVT